MTTITIILEPTSEQHREWLADQVARLVSLAHVKGIDVELTIDESPLPTTA